MPIDTKHPDYIELENRYQLMTDVLKDEEAIKDAGEIYLPKTGGMLENDHTEKRYKAYKMRARFPDITTHTLTGIVGIIFEQDPEGASDEIITRDGRNNIQLARDAVRDVSSFGRDVLVVDAPAAENGGGEPFIAQYHARSFINWKRDDDNPSTLKLAVFSESQSIAEDDYGHETEEVFRKYEKAGDGNFYVSLWKVETKGEKKRDVLLEPPQLLPVKRMPVFTIGSINLTPAPDPIPLLPVARAAISFYQKSANIEHAMNIVTQPTAWARGIDEAQYNAIIDQGYGSSAFWHLGHEGVVGFLQPSADWGPIVERMDWEIRQAENYSVRLTRETTTGESGIALSMRAASQHASIYSIARSVSFGINAAEELRREWAGDRSAYVPLELSTDYDPASASEQMIAVLNNAVNAGNAPRSVLFEAYRKARMTELTDEEMIAEIETQMAAEGLSIDLGEDEPEQPEADVDA